MQIIMMQALLSILLLILLLSSQIHFISPFIVPIKNQRCQHKIINRIWSSFITAEKKTTSDDNGKNEVQVVESSSASSSISSCPVSKSFPRYRIDLTRFKANNNKKKETSWFQSSFIKELSQSMARSKLERTFQKKKNQGDDDDVVIKWETNLDGVKAFAFLWNQAVNLLQSAEQYYEEQTTTTSSKNSDEDNINNNNSSRRLVIALPDSSLQLVQNWVEIVDWMSTIDNPKMRPMITASLIDDDSSSSGIPVVQIQIVKEAEESTISDTTTTTKTMTTNNPDSVQIQIDRTKAWVKRILVEQGICPFTKSVTKSGQGLGDIGVPVGSIAYHGSLATNPIQLMADIWGAMDEMIEAGPRGKTGVSSILLSAPAFDDDFDLWSGPIFAMLESGVVAAKAEDALGVVCFHPRYATPDGTSWPGFGHMHSVPRLEKWYKEYHEEDNRMQQQQLSNQTNDGCPSPPQPSSSLTTEEIAAGGAWQRRTPHATINVLRADQLAAAEGRRKSGSMYTENIEKLVIAIGVDKLVNDLERERQL